MTLSFLISWVADKLVHRRFEFGVIFTVILFELAVRSRHGRRLLPSGYLVDLTYCALYRLGIYALLLERPIYDFVYGNLSVHAVLVVPPWLRVIGYFVAVDFAQYWVHRLQHAVPALWAIHQVHHSQQHLSMMSVYRVHPLDMWMRMFLSPLLWVALVGLPPAMWLGLVLVQEAVLNLSHLEVNWTYGPLRWLLVSPVSHAVHHSVEERHQSKNHGMVLAVWDYLFRTADTGTQRPNAVGLPGWRVRNSVLAHCWAPFRGVFRHYRGLPLDGLAPLTPVAATHSLSGDPPAARL